ncbi:unnamed protein product [Polarella glacialis]|uniref:Uncharacterized protein n=1 Tax=Polarella glacialis TaxID=89957 RepID=A0A813GMI6_POLGL|nr:unnamed protein product [Polarella glacialis]
MSMANHFGTLTRRHTSTLGVRSLASRCVPPSSTTRATSTTQSTHRHRRAIGVPVEDIGAPSGQHLHNNFMDHPINWSPAQANRARKRRRTFEAGWFSRFQQQRQQQPQRQQQQQLDHPPVTTFQPPPGLTLAADRSWQDQNVLSPTGVEQIVKEIQALRTELERITQLVQGGLEQHRPQPTTTKSTRESQTQWKLQVVLPQQAGVQDEDDVKPHKASQNPLQEAEKKSS